MQLHPGDIRFTDGGDYESKDFRGEKIQADTYGLSQQEKGKYDWQTISLIALFAPS